MTDINKTLAERGNRYGEFKDNASLSQKLEDSVRKVAKTGVLKEIHMEAIKFIFQKISRIVNGDPNYIDNWHDIAGYAMLVEKELTKQQKTISDTVYTQEEKVLPEENTACVSGYMKSELILPTHIYTIKHKNDSRLISIFKRNNPVSPNMYYASVPTATGSFPGKDRLAYFRVDNAFRPTKIFVNTEELSIWIDGFPGSFFERLKQEGDARKFVSGLIAVQSSDFEKAIGIPVLQSDSSL